ncbi:MULTISPECIES: TonB-dependent receptor [unclassified Pseudoalteromonas]|uniref:TonB-dependent receptor plug domain-containing protein n=1 Tax=unclassified Pseudoalteromonas TaxID=194690 RepID=UPI000B3CACB9|nr:MULTISPECIES: TonB-dependent receptor [unclassified Pseudoalteromonas]MDN3377207.1 TonB-dependent receptor [Pseudoalteromonas sp. APC 3893]MDN3385625.1 TonB-dependent receptor [Pseudoalteromonas sp. APC 4017]OUS73139.1 ligand-gated channel [Pseudoalteromonas sp. A601]
MFTKTSKLAVVAALLPAYSFAHEQHHDHDEHEKKPIEKIQVTASRLGRIVTESATRTEIINAEEIHEKALMRPGNISMLVAETGGVRVQNTSPALGSANIRLQSLYGRYTQLLSDGLPLYGGQSIGLLQIPPTDLANVEIIKGSASSLYGGSALGGVINLISRTPSDEFEGEVLLNATSKNGQDVTSYFAAPLTDSISASVTAGLHHQEEQDLDDDGWLDMASYNRASVRPRIYWEGDNGANLYVTVGAMTEQRDGGTAENATMPDGNPFAQTQDSLRLDTGFIFDKPLNEVLALNVRGSAMQQDHDHVYGTVNEDDNHESYLFESSISGYTDNIAWLVGAAYQSEKYHSEDFSAFDYSYEVPGVFSQLDYEASENVSLSLSARADWHNEYGTQFSPRISMLYNPENWTVRGSYGKGFFAPTPFIEDIEDAGLSHLEPLENIEEEHANTASIDISYAFDSVETSVTFFSSDVENVTELEVINQQLTPSDKNVRIVNAPGQSEIRGAEFLLRYRWNDIKLTGSYLYTDASKQSSSGTGRVPLTLTPEHSAGAVIMWEEHGSHLVGFEAYYTGTQHLENNPYRDKSDAYWHLGLLGQITVGRISYFVNAENLLNVRQTKEDSLILPQQAPSGRWTTDIWSRNDGFTVNAGIRIKFND